MREQNGNYMAAYGILCLIQVPLFALGYKWNLKGQNLQAETPDIRKQGNPLGDPGAAISWE